MNANHGRPALSTISTDTNRDRLLRFLLPALLALLLLSGCGGEKNGQASGTLFAMDTVMNLSVYGPEETAARAEADAETLIRSLERELSVTDPGSEIHAVNLYGGGTVSGETAALLESALSLCAETGGALDISIYPVVRAWGFTAKTADTGEDAYTVPDRETLDSLLRNVDYTRVRLDTETGEVSLDPGMEIDLGSVAKGWTADRLTELLRGRGIESALLDLGGNVQAIGSKPDGSPWRVGIRDPGSEDIAGVLEIRNRAVVTSGGYERYFVRDGVTYWHIIDPADGMPADSGLASVSVIGEEGVRCDALSTALFVMGKERAAEFWRAHTGFELVLIDADGGITITEGLEGSFTPAGTHRDDTAEVLRKAA